MAEIPLTRIDVGSAGGVQQAVPADLDKDGDLDVVAAVSTEGAMTWWRNDGGSWVEMSVDAAFAGAGAVAVFDLDADGDADVIGASSSSGVVAWWENDGAAGTWTEHSIDPGLAGASSLEIADVDGDGDGDLLGAGLDADAVVWWENDGSTPWPRRTIGGAFDGARWASAGDIDGDGDLDVVGVAVFDDAVAWWENTDGAGGSWSEHPIDGAFVSGTFVATGDIDGDGALDVLGAAFGGDEAAWWRNGGDGSSWTRQSISSEDGARTAVPVDLDRDGDLDVLVAGNMSDRMSWWENADGDGTLWSERNFDSSADGAASLAFGDYDLDGDLDLLGAAAQAGSVFWWRNEESHGLVDAGPLLVLLDVSDEAASSLETRDAFAGDIDRDGDQDLLYFFQGSRLAWLENLDGSGTAWGRHTVHDFGDSPAFGLAVLADLDGDGDLDAASKLAQNGAQQLAWFENPGTTLPWTRRSIQAQAGVRYLLAVDLDTDGDIDLVGSEGPFQGIFQWWENFDGVATDWRRRIVGTADASLGAQSLAIIDVDRDGKLDVVVREARSTSSSGQELSWWRNVDGSSFTRQLISATTGAAMAVADFDRDGAVDVGTATSDFFGLGDFTWWRNSGDGATWTVKPVIAIDQEEAANVNFRAEDLNSDGAPDIAGERFWARNPGDGGTDWPIRDLCSRECARSGDFDGDGSGDFVVHEDDTLRFLQGARGQYEIDAEFIFFEPVVRDDTPFFAFTVRHLGIDADRDLRLVRFVFAATELGVPVTPGEFNDFFSQLRLVRDDGSGDYEPGLDAEVAGVTSPFAFEDGALVLDIPNGPEALLSSGKEATFFLTGSTVLENLPQTRNLIFEHRQALAQAESVAPVASLKQLDPTTTGWPIILPGIQLFEDDFESGDTSNWFLTVN